jgi:hypothetical protein
MNRRDFLRGTGVALAVLLARALSKPTEPEQGAAPDVSVGDGVTIPDAGEIALAGEGRMSIDRDGARAWGSDGWLSHVLFFDGIEYNAYIDGAEFVRLDSQGNELVAWVYDRPLSPAEIRLEYRRMQSSTRAL